VPAGIDCWIADPWMAGPPPLRPLICWSAPYTQISAAAISSARSSSASSRSFAGAKVVLDHLNAKILAGAEIDHALVAMHAAAISAQVRCAAKLGCARRARPVMDLDTYLAAKAKEKREAVE